MKLKIFRGNIGHLVFKTDFRNLEKKVKNHEAIVVETNKEIHVINIKTIVNNELINDCIKSLILNNKKIIDNTNKTMFILELFYRL